VSRNYYIAANNTSGGIFTSNQRNSENHKQNHRIHVCKKRLPTFGLVNIGGISLKNPEKWKGEIPTWIDIIELVPAAGASGGVYIMGIQGCLHPLKLNVKPDNHLFEEEHHLAYQTTFRCGFFKGKKCLKTSVR